MGELTIDECKRIISEGRRQLTEAQKRIAELERSLEHYRLEVICYENDVDRRDALIRDMCEWLSDDAIGIFAERMRELGIEVDE